MNRRSFATLLLASALMASCASTGVPDGIEPVGNFDVDRYLGKWYEIARLDHRFERGLEAVSAEYSQREDGLINVRNRGWSTDKDEWKEADGRAKFAGADDTGQLEVSFFGPFFASYVIFELDEDYSRAWVTGNDRSTLWLLSRTPTVDDAAFARFESRATALGFELDELIRVDQTRNRSN